MLGEQGASLWQAHKYQNIRAGNTKGGKYHCTVDLLFDWFGLASFANKNKNCQLSYSWFQTSQTGGQRYSDTLVFPAQPHVWSKYAVKYRCWRGPHFYHIMQGILKGDVSLYHWPPVWLVWNQLYDNWQYLFLFAKEINPNQSKWYSDTSPF